MTTAVHTKMMTETQFRRLGAIIHERSGIHFPASKKYVLESRLSQRLMELGIEDYDTYITCLAVGPHQWAEFQEMLDRVTINETSFFRDDRQLAVFERTVLPELLAARAGSRRLRLWSAACASGEEPYTLAILVHRALGARLPDWRVEILGTDISDKALSAGITGVYTDQAVSPMPKTVRDRYFSPEDRHWRIDDTIRSMVSFDRHNLRDRLGAARYGIWDAIFCRNVLIYFDEDMRRRVVELFHDRVANDGYLFIGHSESLRDLGVPFESAHAPEGFCYRKSPMSDSA